MNGSVNVPGISGITLEQLRGELLRSFMMNELTLPLATSAGEPLLTSGGTPILAVYHPNQSARVLAAMAAMDTRLSEQIGQTAADARTYTDRKVLGLERRLDTDAESVDAKITVAKQEAVSTASEDAAKRDEVVKKKLIYRIANDIYEHTNNSSAHPEMLRTSQGYYAGPPDALSPPPEDVMDIFDAYI